MDFSSPGLPYANSPAPGWQRTRAAAIVLLALLLSAIVAVRLPAQQPGAAPAAGNVGNNALRGAGQPNLAAVGDPGGGPAGGAFGGAANADFDSLIDLITNTVERDTWLENGTGEGEIAPFAINGVYVDAAGALRTASSSQARSLAAIRARGLRAATASSIAPARLAAPDLDERRDARRDSLLRFVSLPRLEAAIAARQRQHALLDAEMLTLAGLRRVAYVVAYPESGDLVLAGPAGDWRSTSSGALVGADSGAPLVRLDDLLTLLRRRQTERSSAFGCSIVPRQESLARTQEYLAASAARPLEPGGRRAWLDELRTTLGEQDVEYFGLDANTRVAGVLLAADYHMKLVGMGLAPGVPGVKSYLATVRLGADGQAPPMNVLRWWFSMPAATIETSAAHDAFGLPAQCVEVLSENELLAARGERVHTGAADALTQQFSRTFTQEFAALSEKYPIYAELQRLFELEISLVVIDREGLAEQVGWTPTLFADGSRLRLPRAAVPRTVETVMNHRVIAGRHIIAGISGGVRIDGAKSVNVAEVAVQASGKLADVRQSTARPEAGAWWWDEK